MRDGMCNFLPRWDSRKILSASAQAPNKCDRGIRPSGSFRHALTDKYMSETRRLRLPKRFASSFLLPAIL